MNCVCLLVPLTLFAVKQCSINCVAFVWRDSLQVRILSLDIDQTIVSDYPVAYPGGFSGCPETPPPDHDFFKSGLGDTVTDTDPHPPLTFATFGNPLQTNSGYATVTSPIPTIFTPLMLYSIMSLLPTYVHIIVYLH